MTYKKQESNSEKAAAYPGLEAARAKQAGVLAQLKEVDGRLEEAFTVVDPEKLDFRCRRLSPLFFETIEASRKLGAKKLRPTAAACGSSSQRRSGWH